MKDKTADHRPVLVKEVMNALRVKDDSIIVDATYGRGGHAQSVIDKLGSDGRIVVFDKDPQAIQHAKTHWQHDARVQIVHARFSLLKKNLIEKGLSGRVNGVLIDLGVSSPQLDQADRGFSFNTDGPLDMRMDPQEGQSAAEWIETVDAKVLVQVLRQYGDERFAKRIAQHIVISRDQECIDTTAKLARIVSSAVPVREKGKHPATRTFQAIRIVINDEMNELISILPQAVNVLASGGRMVVISFHSHEDRKVKRFMRQNAKGDPFPPDLPVTEDQMRPLLRLVGKPVRPGEAEIFVNRRARSAVMRVAEKI